MLNELKSKIEQINIFPEKDFFDGLEITLTWKTESEEHETIDGVHHGHVSLSMLED